MTTRTYGSILTAALMLLLAAPVVSQASEDEYDCAAIVLRPDIDECLMRDEVLQYLPIADFNRLVCSNQPYFDLDHYRFVRDPISHNLLSANDIAECEWEVRAVSRSEK